MAKFIPKSDYMNYAPALPGEQVHVNHTNCSAGIDRKRRLYIKRLDTNTVVAYCHHCGKSGRSNKIVGSRSKEPTALPPPKQLWSLPADYTQEFSTAAKAWVENYITLEVAKKYHIGYSPKMRRVILPVWKDGKLAMYQARRLYSDDPKPKYLTYKNDEATFLSLTNGNDYVILVEDMLSAIVLNNYGYDSLSMFGTHCNKQVADYVISKYARVIVMLDDNNNDVKKQALRIQSTLNMFVPPVLIAYTNGVDPKNMSKPQIEHCLRAVTL